MALRGLAANASGSLAELVVNVSDVLPSNTSSSVTPSPLASIVAATLTPLLNSSAANASASAKVTPSPAQLAGIAAKKAIMAFMLEKIHTLQLFLLAGYSIMFFLCLVLITYLRFNRHVAFKGDESAARKVILPAFEPLLCILAVATGTYTLFFCTALLTNMYTYEISKLATEVFYSGRQFVFLSVVVFMLQKSVSGPALRRTVLITFVLSTYTIPVVWYMTTYRPASELYAATTASRAPMLLLYTYIFIRPPGRASKRTLREFCIFAYIYYALLFTYNELFRLKKLEAGFNLTYANLLCGSLCPLVIWRVLRADTEHWRGMGQRACALQRLFRQNKNLPERVSSKGLHVLIEMHRKYIIDFAFLELKQRIGVGASAVVFNGLLKSTIPVAVKVYTPVDFTEDTVAEFSQEAALCGALHHPNIVRFYGMCVSPPTICLVSELCQGSLEDVTCAIARREAHHNRQQMLLNLAYMLDAARAVAYIHSFSPPFVHRDIKPANFLVDAESTVKLTDFGESRSLPRGCMRAESSSGKKTESSVASSSSKLTKDGTGQQSVSLLPSSRLQHIQSSRAASGAGDHVDDACMTVKGTVDYMAPEIIQGRAGQATYGEAADVYSLGITMWDILNPGREKFPTTKNNHFLVFENVTAGERPELDARMHPGLRSVIETSWHGDPRLRPSAQSIVATLESIQEELCAAFAMELSDELEDALMGTRQASASLTDQSFTGNQAIELMEQSCYVSSLSEATRLGNALMDAGLMHHLKHAHPFEASDALYYFDESNINLCKPLVVGAYDGHGRATTPRSKLDVDEINCNASDKRDTVVRLGAAGVRPSRQVSHATSSTHGNTISEYLRGGGSSQSDQPILENGLCACSRLAQRLQLPKASVRQRLRRKYKVIAEENVLATRLLHGQHEGGGGQFTGLTSDSGGTSSRAHFDLMDFDDFVDSGDAHGGSGSNALL